MSENKKLLKLTISKVDAPVFDGEVVSVTVPGSEGEMTIMADHQAIITVLKAGKVTVKDNTNTVTQYDVTAGTIEISANHATILI